MCASKTPKNQLNANKICNICLHWQWFKNHLIILYCGLFSRSIHIFETKIIIKNYSQKKIILHPTFLPKPTYLISLPPKDILKMRENIKRWKLLYHARLQLNATVQSHNIFFIIYYFPKSIYVMDWK